MSFPVESDIAPVARFLLYAVLPEGDVVGDSAKYEVENCLANKVGASYHKFFNIKLEVTIIINYFLHLSIETKGVK